jgi:hypothetical protein
MAPTRACEQCATAFIPRREHSRFCSAQCRVAWNCQHARQEGVSSTALDWSLSAMTEATARLARSRPPDAAKTEEAHATVAVSDAVWWVTIVDATLIRYHPDSYDATVDALPGARQREIEQTLAGLRFVRNQMGVHLDPGEFIGALPDSGTGERQGPELTWNPLAPPTAGDLSPSGLEWERGRYQAYAERLAGHAVVPTFALATRFLRHAAANAAVASDEVTAAQAPRQALRSPAPQPR